MSVTVKRIACPWLPPVDVKLGPEVTRSLPEKNEAFYEAALRYAQSLWLEGKPAQALLQLNKAWMAEMSGDEPILKKYPPPYRALRWLMRHAKSGEHGFMGNPLRHFQHLASRMSGPRAEVRTWRAWACLMVAAAELEHDPQFPRDGVQLAREGLWIPGKQRIRHELIKRGWGNEVHEWEAANHPDF